jgi:hypothetical protein
MKAGFSRVRRCSNLSSRSSLALPAHLEVSTCYARDLGDLCSYKFKLLTHLLHLVNLNKGNAG